MEMKAKIEDKDREGKLSPPKLFSHNKLKNSCNDDQKEPIE